MKEARRAELAYYLRSNRPIKLVGKEELISEDYDLYTFSELANEGYIKIKSFSGAETVIVPQCDINIAVPRTRHETFLMEKDLEYSVSSVHLLQANTDLKHT